MTGLRRHRQDQGYARGEETRARIIAAAVSLFAEKSFEGTSTREIAARGEVSPHALQYYFGGKRALYLACIDHIQSTVRDAIEPTLAAAEAQLAAAAPPERLVDAYCALLETLIDTLIGTTDAHDRALFMGRRQFGEPEPTHAHADKMVFAGRVYAVCAALVAGATGLDPSSDDIRLIVIGINGPVLSLHLGRERLLNLVGWNDMTGDRLDRFKASMRRQIRRTLAPPFDF